MSGLGSIALSVCGTPVSAALARAFEGAALIREDDHRSRTAAAAALARVSEKENLQALIHAWVPDAALAARPLARLDDQDWDAGCERVIRSTIVLMQAAYEHFRERGGVIIVVQPTIGLAGQKNFAAYSAACEAQRCLVKSVARAWGRRNIRAHSVVAAPELFGGEMAESAPRESLLSPLSLRGRTSEALLDSVVSTVRFLLSDGASNLTGTTTAVDAGRWMPL